jgi:polysaccharide biosynthesis/export protein
MDNLNTTAMRKYVPKERIEVKPTLVPITASLIADQSVGTYNYQVAPSDVLSIHVWQHPEFLIEAATTTVGATSTQGAAGTSGYLVNTKGDIYFPLIGYIHVAKKTVDEIREDISKRLEKYVPNPQVNVRVSDFRGQKIYVLGEVGTVGFVPITDQNLTLTDALALSGWMKLDAADPHFIYVIRGDYTQPTIFWLNAKTPDRLLLAEHFSLQPRDVLYVTTAQITRLNRTLNQVLPFIQAIWFTQAVIRNA